MRSYDVLARVSNSRRSSVSPSDCSCTHMLRAMYGAGMIPGRSTSSPNVSGVHLKPIWCGGSRLTTTNIFFATEKHRSLPHLTSSVTAGSDWQIFLSVSIVMDPRVPGAERRFRRAYTGSRRGPVLSALLRYEHHIDPVVVRVERRRRKRDGCAVAVDTVAARGRIRER